MRLGYGVTGARHFLSSCGIQQSAVGQSAPPLDFSASKSRAFRGYARQMQAFAERVGLRPPSLQGASPCSLRRCCHLAPGSKTGSHAFDGMASCFAEVVHGGAFWCQRYRTIRSWRWNCVVRMSTKEHQQPKLSSASSRSSSSGSSLRMGEGAVGGATVISAFSRSPS